jgi:hypothetical protein
MELHTCSDCSSDRCHVHPDVPSTGTLLPLDIRVGHVHTTGNHYLCADCYERANLHDHPTVSILYSADGSAEPFGAER